jgi:UDP-glucose 4-epimerase
MSQHLVTGGAGFIGSHLTHRLVADGHSVRVFDNLSTGSLDNLSEIRNGIEFRHGDLRDLEAVEKACEGVEVVFHQGALPSVPRSIEDPVSSHEVNVTGTFHVLYGARQEGVRRVVFASSSSIYGDIADLPTREDSTPAPLSPYAAGKLIGEQYCRMFSTCYGLETASLRYFNVFGPRQDPTSQYAAAIPIFVTSILHGESPTVFGDGEQTRDFTHIDNVVEANLRAADCPVAEGEPVNIACGERVSVNSVIERINELLGVRVVGRHVDPRPGDIPHSCADIERARILLDYDPVLYFDAGLRLSIEYYKSLA